jgi:prepilin-type N-terminal cleavage/methylation domain-containing protein
MKPRFSHQTNRALTLVEVLVVIAILAVLVALLVPALAEARKKSQLISCNGNLKEIGLSFRVWEGDHGDKPPMQISVTNGGTMELAKGNNAWINFAVMSNELSSPRTVICPADKTRYYAANFSTDFNNSKVSYFVGLDAVEPEPSTYLYSQRLLSGDENFAISGVPVKPGLLEITTNSQITWTSARHQFIGNIGMADGSVEQIRTTGLEQAIQNTGLATNRLAIP